MDATLMKKSGGMNKNYKTGGMHPVKKTGGMHPAKKTGGMHPAKKTGGMNVTKKVGGKCGMAIHAKGGMYKKTKGGTLKKLLKGGDDGVLAMNGVKYQVKMDGVSVTVTKLVDDEIPEPAPKEEDELLEDLDDDGKGPLTKSDLNTDEDEDAADEDAANEDDDVEPELNDVADTGSKELKDLIEGIEGDFEKEDIVENYNKLTDKDKTEAINYIKESDRLDKEGILQELQGEDDDDKDDDTLDLDSLDGGKRHKKKKGGKTLKKGGKLNKKHAGSVKKAFHKLFKRGGNKALPKKGGKK